MLISNNVPYGAILTRIAKATEPITRRRGCECRWRRTYHDCPVTKNRISLCDSGISSSPYWVEQKLTLWLMDVGTDAQSTVVRIFAPILYRAPAVRI